MVQRVQVILEDDMTGGEASETVEFSLDGVNYEIDLNDENAAQLREAFAPWIAEARRSGGRRQTRRRGAAGAGASGNGPAKSDELAKMREWGREKPHGKSLWWPVVARNKKSITLDLRQPDRSLQVGHAIVEAHELVPEVAIGAKGMVAQIPGEFGDLTVVGGNHPPFTRGNNLIAIEAKARGIPQAACASPFILRAV